MLLSSKIMPGKAAKIQVPDQQIGILQEIAAVRTATLRLDSAKAIARDIRLAA
jgi:hypothetical protein